jgi:hypothetical protein
MSRRERGRSPSGLGVLEVLVALALSSLGLAALALASRGVLAAFQADPASADQHQRGRVALAALVEHVTGAGAGFLTAAGEAPGQALPAVVPDRLRRGAWTVAAAPAMVSTIAAARSAAQARLSVAALAGDTRLVLERPAYCSALSPTCRFAAGDEVVLAGPHGRFALAAVDAVSPPLLLDLAAPLAESWPVGTLVAAVDAHTYLARPDPATGLLQIARASGAGTASAMIDFVERFEVTWALDGRAPQVRLAPDGSEEDASAGPAPPPSGEPGDAAWPPGENCVFARTAAGLPVARLPPLGTGPVTVTLAALSDGPWCPSAAAPTRWDADLARVAVVRVRVALAVASAMLRPPTGVVLAGPGVARSRFVPTLTVTAEVAPGRGGGLP